MNGLFVPSFLPFFYSSSFPFALVDMIINEVHVLIPTVTKIFNMSNVKTDFDRIIGFCLPFLFNNKD